MSLIKNVADAVMWTAAALFLALAVMLCSGCSSAATKVEASKSGPTTHKKNITSPAGKKRIIIRPCTIEKCEVPNG